MSDAPFDIRVHLALTLVQLIFSSFHVIGKAVLARLSPLALAGIRVMVAVPIFLSLSSIIDRYRPSWRQQLRLALLGCFGVFGNQLLFISGLARTSATNAAILMPAIPAFTVLVGAVLRIERVTARRLIGVGLVMAGALVLLRPHRFDPSQGTVLGNLLVLANCFSYATFLVLQRPLHRQLPWLTMIAWAYLWGGGGVLAVTWPDLLAIPLAQIPSVVWAGVAYTALVPTVLGYMLNTWAVRRSSAVTAAAYTTLQPLFSSALAALLLGERLGMVELFAFVLIVAGLWQTSSSRGPS